MSDEQIERLITEGFLFEAMSLRGSTLSANYGDGYGEGAVIGHPEGLLKWKMKIGALPNITGENLVNAGEQGLQTRGDYLWKFFERHNVRNAHKPFWFRDPASQRDYLAEIVEEELDYRMLSRLVYSTGLTIRQRRVSGVESPGEAVTMENNAEI